MSAVGSWNVQFIPPFFLQNKTGDSTGIILCMGLANERRRCIAMPSLIDRAHIEPDWSLFYE